MALVRRPSNLVLAMLAGLVLRILWAIWAGSSAMHVEEVNYARLGENLALGRGYLGMRENGLQLLYPPAFPLLLAFATFVLRNAEVAGRVVSIIAGTALVWPVRRIADRLFDPPVGVIAAWLVATNPILVAGGASVYSECLFLVFLFAGAWWGMRAFDDDAGRAAGLAGAAFGAAYLTRPEGIGAMLVFAVGLILSRRRRARVVPLLACFGVLAFPYILFVWLTTGMLRLETKSGDNISYAQAIARGASFQEAVYGITDDLTGVGLNMRSNRDVLRATRQSPAALIQHVALGARTNLPVLARQLAGPALGAPILLVLVGLGLLGRSPSPPSIRDHLLLAATFGLVLLAFTTLIWFSGRYLLLFLPFLLIWAASGVHHVGVWTLETGRSLALRETVRRLAAAATALGSALLLIAMTQRSIMSISDFAPGNARAREIGRSLLRHGSRRTRIATRDPVLAYYAGALYIPLPHSSGETALRYIERAEPDYMVLENRHDEDYLTEWIGSGVPSPHAQLQRRWIAGRDTVLVVRWTGNERTP